MPHLQPYKNYFPVVYDYATELPVGWQLLPNIAIFQERIERGHDKEELLSVTIGRGVIKQTEVEIKKDNSNEDKSKYKLVKQGDIAYNKMRMWQGALGYSQYTGIASPAYVVLKPKMKINPRFFHYMFRTGFYTNYSKRFSYGIVDDQLSLRYTDFKRMYSIVPPLEVQNQIVNYLDRKNEAIEKFIRNKERLIELLEEEKKDKINSAFTKGLNPNVELKYSEINWLENIPKHWEVKRLKFLTKIISKGSTPSTEGRSMADEGIRFLKAENIFNSQITELPSFYIDAITHRIMKRSQLEENDLLFVIAGATIGKVGILKKEFLPANTNQAVSFIRLKRKVDVEYCFYWLQSTFITTSIWLKAVTAAQPNLAMEDLGNLVIPYPPEKEKLELVEHIKQEHEILDLAISKAQKEIASIKEYREAIVTNAVTGKINVTSTQLQMN